MNLSAYLSALAPELVLTIVGCAVLLVGLSRRAEVRRLVPMIAILSVLVAGVIALAQGGNAPREAPPGLIGGPLTYYIRLIALGVGALILLVNWHLAEDGDRGEFFGMILFALVGAMLTASANDLLLLFFAIELVSVPTYVLVALSRQDRRASEAAVKYFFLGALSAAIMVYGFSFLYGAAGTTTLTAPDGAALSAIAAGETFPAYATIGLLLALAGLFFKMAAVPFHVYAPDVYEGAASPVTGLLGFLPKLAGLIGIVKLLSALQWDVPGPVLWMLWVVAALTMTVGNVLALLQDNAKRILAYSSIAHSGYILIGVLVGPVAGEGPLRDGVAASLFYIAVYGAMNLGAFAALSCMSADGKEIEQLGDLAGCARRHPFAALGLAVCAFSLMGFPPTAGFLGKVYVFSSAFSLPADHPMHGPLVTLAVIGVVNSAIAAAYYLRLAASSYLKPATADVQSAAGPHLRWGLALCSVAMLALFVWPRALVGQAGRASVGMSVDSPTRVAWPALTDSPADPAGS